MKIKIGKINMDKDAKTVEKTLRKETVKPVQSGSQYSVLPIKSLFYQLIHSECSVMHLMGQVIDFWGYIEPTEIDIFPVNLDNFLGSESEGGILTKSFKAIDILHFRNGDDKEKQLKDFGKMIWLLETYRHRKDRFCPKCSDQIPVRFPDIYKSCPICLTKLEVKEHMPRRFRSHHVK